MCVCVWSNYFCRKERERERESGVCALVMAVEKVKRRGGGRGGMKKMKDGMRKKGRNVWNRRECTVRYERKRSVGAACGQRDDVDASSSSSSSSRSTSTRRSTMWNRGGGRMTRRKMTKRSTIRAAKKTHATRIEVRCAAWGSRDGNAPPPSPFEPIVKDVDYYTLLGVERDATEQQIKVAWRQKAKLCHPDLPHIGDEGQDLCVLLNEACRVLTDEVERAAYDFSLEEDNEVLNDGYTGMPLSKWCGPGHKRTRSEHEDDAKEAVFVDELACIGCQNCVWCAGATFKMEPEYGRARVWNQWLNTREDIDTAIDSCPVNCIHWVDTKELPALEFVMQSVLQRVDVGIMMAGQGGAFANADVFEETAVYMQQRQKLEEEQERRRELSRETRRKRREAADRIQQEEDMRAAGYNPLAWAQSVLLNLQGNPNRELRRTRWQEQRNAAARKAAAARKRAANAAENVAENVVVAVQETYSVPFERALVPIRVNRSDPRHRRCR